jgi:3-oxoacyl-[acyl-carrier protein] reductase
VARAFAREGATVHLAGRTRPKLDALAADLHAAGARAEPAVVDALDEAAVDAHADAVVRDFGTLDISMNLISHGDVQGTPLAELTVADLERPVHTALRTMFVTARAAARHMIPQGSGVILGFGGTGDPPRGSHLGGLQVAFNAQEMLARALATELAPAGIRVLTLQTSGVPGSIAADNPHRQAITDAIDASTLTGRAATLEDVGRVAVFAASDHARTLTGSQINMSCGAIPGR